jgi:hypothetical protein
MYGKNMVMPESGECDLHNCNSFHGRGVGYSIHSPGKKVNGFGKGIAEKKDLCYNR